MKKLFNKKGVFGLTAIQQFFGIILGIALLAYVIVVIIKPINHINSWFIGKKSNNFNTTECIHRNNRIF
jgi:hypothetical protein